MPTAQREKRPMNSLARKVTVAAVQTDIASLDREANAERMYRWIEDVASAHDDVDLIVFPELANIGYVRDRDREFGAAYIEAAEAIPGPTIEVICAAAKKHQVTVVAGMAEAHPVIPATLYNSAVLIGPSGEIIGKYRKIHVAGEEKHYFRPGDRIPVFDTPVGRLGVAICYDTFFPEMTRILALKGAEILCFPFNAWSGVENSDVIKHVSVARAVENRLFVVASNRVGEDSGRVFFGGSSIAGPRGGLLASAGGSEEVIISALHRTDFVKERAMVPVFADRRPDLYAQVAYGDPADSVTRGSGNGAAAATPDSDRSEVEPRGAPAHAEGKG